MLDGVTTFGQVFQWCSVSLPDQLQLFIDDTWVDVANITRFSTTHIHVHPTSSYEEPLTCAMSDTVSFKVQPFAPSEEELEWLAEDNTANLTANGWLFLSGEWLKLDRNGKVQYRWHH